MLLSQHGTEDHFLYDLFSICSLCSQKSTCGM